MVETPADQAAIERTSTFRGLYFVLMGKLSPLDGIGPKELGFEKLSERCSDGQVKEVILATNFTGEGEATGACEPWYRGARRLWYHVLGSCRRSMKL